MTTDREEKLITDVAWMRGQLETFFNSVSPTLATKESVEAVDLRISSHCDGHKDSKNLLPVWVGIAISCISGLTAVFISVFDKGGFK